MESLNPHQFDLYCDGQSLGTFELPFYWKRNRTIGRVMLTPPFPSPFLRMSLSALSALSAAASEHEQFVTVQPRDRF